MAGADAPAVFDRAGKRAAFARNGDIFVRDLAGGRLTQITRTAQNEAAPQFSADGRLLSFRVDNDWFVHDFSTGITAPAAVVKNGKGSGCAAQSRRFARHAAAYVFDLEEAARRIEESKKHAEDLRKGDATRAAAPYYLGEDVSIRDAELSPDARWLIVVTVPKAYAKGFEGRLTRYVTESGYEEFEPERLRVGRNPPAPQSLLLLNLVDHTVHSLGVENLPGIGDDPLKTVREMNGTRDVRGRRFRRQVLEAGGARRTGGVPMIRMAAPAGIVWSRDGGALAIQLVSIDNKGPLDRQRGFREVRAGPAASAERSGMDQLDLRRIWLARRQPAPSGTSRRKPVMRICIRRHPMPSRGR